MAHLREFQLELCLSNGSRMHTRFSQYLEDHQRPATRYYLGYSSDTQTTQDLPWIVVGDIAYMPDEVVAVQIQPIEGVAEDTHGLRAVR